MSETSVSNVSFKRPVVAGADNKNSGVRVNVPAKSAADSVELSTKGKSDEKKKPNYVKIGLSVLGAAACIYGGVKLFKYFKGKPGGGGAAGGGGGAAGKVEPKKPKVDISKSETGSKGNADSVADGAKSASAPKTGVAEEPPKTLKADNAGGASESAAEKTSGLGENGAGNANALKTDKGNTVPDNTGGASESAAENSSKAGSGLKTDAAENTSKTLGAGEVPKTDNAVEPQQKKIVSVSEKQKLPELETDTFKPDKPLVYTEFLKTASAENKLQLDKTASVLNKKYNIVDEKSLDDIKSAVLDSLVMTAFLTQSGLFADEKDIDLLSEAEFLDKCCAELTDGKREHLNKPVTELLDGISDETIDKCQNLSGEARSHLKERFEALKENFAYIDFDSWVDGAGEENPEVSESSEPEEAPKTRQVSETLVSRENFSSTQNSYQTDAADLNNNNSVSADYGQEDIDKSFRRNQEQREEAAKKQRERDEEFCNNINTAATGAYAVDNLTGQPINSGVDNIYSDNSIITGYNSSPEPQPFDYDQNNSMFGTSTYSDYENQNLSLNNYGTDYTGTDLLGGGDYLSGNVGDYGSDF